MQGDWKKQREIEFARIQQELGQKASLLTHVETYGFKWTWNHSCRNEEQKAILEPFRKASKKDVRIAAQLAYRVLNEHIDNRKKFIEKQPKKLQHFQL